MSRSFLRAHQGLCESVVVPHSGQHAAVQHDGRPPRAVLHLRPGEGGEAAAERAQDGVAGAYVPLLDLRHVHVGVLNKGGRIALSVPLKRDIFIRNFAYEYVYDVHKKFEYFANSPPQTRDIWLFLDQLHSEPSARSSCFVKDDTAATVQPNW